MVCCPKFAVRIFPPRRNAASPTASPMPSPTPPAPPLALLLLLLLPRVLSQSPCTAGMGFLGRPLPASPQPPPAIAPGAECQACAWLCHATPACAAVTYEAGSPACGPRGCCHLLASGSWLNATRSPGLAGVVLRHAPSTFPPAPPPSAPPPGAKNVLHILVDDLRPDLAPFGPAFMRTPALAALAAQSALFSRAYCNIAVCSPSRLSFLSGRRPATAKAFNFINHFRQANCVELPNTGLSGATYQTIPMTSGGAGQCCSHCEANPLCGAWGFRDGLCRLKREPGARSFIAGAVAGLRGAPTTRAWTTLPQAFYGAGYSVYGTGKVFHTEEGGTGPLPWDGGGMPPLQDPPSWTRAPNATMGDVNALAPMWPCAAGGACGEPGDAEGTPLSPSTKPFEDAVIAQEAVARIAALGAARAAGGAPFYMAVGFRKPHLPFRHPSFYDAAYAPVNATATARYNVLDASVPSIAFHQVGLAQDPYKAVPRPEAQQARADYYAAISWIDHQVGAVLKALDDTGLAGDTLVLFHA